jgi:hypothetical protein
MLDVMKVLEKLGTLTYSLREKHKYFWAVNGEK